MGTLRNFNTYLECLGVAGNRWSVSPRLTLGWTQSTNSTGIPSASRRALSSGRELRQGIVSAHRFNMICGSSRGGCETNSGATGNSSSSEASGFPCRALSPGAGADDFFIQLQGAILKEHLPNIFRVQIELVNSYQALHILKVF